MSSNSSMSVGVCVKSSPLSTINCNTVNTAERSPTRRRSTMKRRSQNAEIRTSFPGSVNAVGEGKENMEPFIEESDNEEDEEVFFGDITDMERFKMAKLRRKTQVFVANFRDVSSSGSGTDSFDESSSTHHSPSSQDSSVVICSSTEPESPASCNSSGETAAMHQHPKPSHLDRMAPSSIDSPSVLAHRAAAKIQTWFRLTRQAQEYQGVMREVERLEAKTDDFIQKIRREKERIKQCSTPEQGGRLDTASSSPMVIVPSHRLHLVETTPQQDNDVITLQQSLNPAKLSSDSTADVIFNATNDSDSINTTTSGGASFSPVKFDESISQSCSAQSEVPKADSESNCSAAEQESYDTPDRHVQGTYQSKTNASVESSLYSTPSFVQSGSASQVTSVSSAGFLYHGAYSKVASDVKAHAVSGEHFVGTPSELRKTERNATNSPFLQVDNSSASYPQRTPLRQLQMSGTLSSFPKVTYEQIQSPTVFSSPRLFPVSVQAVQSQQSVSSAALFSPLKISDHTPVQDYQHSETMMSQSFSAKVTESQRPQKEIEKENHSLAFDCDTRQPTVRNADSVSQDLDYHARPRLDSFTASSTPLATLPVSPNISVVRSAQKVAIVTPNSPLLPNTSRSVSKSHSSRCEMEYETMPIADEGLSTTQEQGRSHHFFPSPVVMTRDTQESQTPSVSQTDPASRPDPSNASRLEAAYGGRPGITTSPITGTRSCESARRKVELLEQKRAELARLRAEKAELKQTLKTENEMCFAMKQEVKAALRSNTSQTNIPVHLLSLGCQGISSLTLTDQELDIVTRLHTIRNSHHDNLQGMAASPMVTPIPHKGSLHLQWHSDLVTEVHCLSSPGHPVRVARPILANQDVCKARRVPAARTASPAQRVPTRQDRSRHPSGYTRTPREKLAF